MGLVAHAGYVNSVRKCAPVLLKHIFHALSECHDIVVRQHLHVHYEAGVPVVGNVLGGRFVAPFYACDVLKAYHPALRVGPDYPFGNLPLGSHGGGDAHPFALSVMHVRARRERQRSGLIVQENGRRVNPVGRQPFPVQGYGNLLLLRADDRRLRKLRNALEPDGEFLGIFLQLQVALFRRFHRQQQRAGVAEIVQHRDGENSGGKRELLLLQAQLYLGPDLVLEALGNFVPKVDINVADAVFRSGIGSFPVHLLEGEKIVFQRLGEPLLHLGGACAGIYAGNQPLLELEGGELVLVHSHEAESAKRDEDQYQDGHKAFLPYRPPYPGGYSAFLEPSKIHYFSTFTFMPDDTFLRPSIMTISPSSMPPVTEIPL